MSNSALASLTAQYTDSENEDDHHDDGSSDSALSTTSQPPLKPPSPIATPEKPKNPKKSLRLVSYQDDTIVSDEEDTESEQEDNESSSSQNAKEEKRSTPSDEVTKMDVDEDTTTTNKSTPQKEAKSDKYAHYGFSLPPEPKGKPTSELVEKIRHLYDKMETSNMDMNKIIQERKDFRNPSIYEKLISFCDINEFGTNYPPEIYDPLQWGPESFYEELAKAQKAEMVKRQKEKKDSDKIEQATAAARKVEEEAKKRKSKWDQPAPIKTAPPALTTTVTGTKGTVISAFGSLPKKANV